MSRGMKGGATVHTRAQTKARALLTPPYYTGVLERAQLGLPPLLLAKCRAQQIQVVVKKRV